MGINDELLIKYDLKVDDVITQEMIDSILVQEEKNDIKNRMLRLMRHRIRSSNELEQRFLRNGHDHKLVSEVLEDLAQEKILDKDQLIRAFISDNTNINPHGNHHILFELRKKGIPEKEIMQTLAQRDEKNVALDYINKKLKALRLQDPKDRRKAINRLLNRGFTPSLVYEIIKELSGAANDQ